MGALLGAAQRRAGGQPLRFGCAAAVAVAALWAVGVGRGGVPPRAAPGEPVHFVIEPYVQDAQPDGIVIAWITSGVTSGVVRVDLPQGRAAFVSSPGTDHKVRVSGLSAGTRYRYVVAARRVGDEAAPETLSVVSEFATTPLAGPFMFLVYGDNRDRDADHRAVIQAMMPEHPDFILQTGDMVSRASDDLQWQRYFAAAGPLMRSIPMYPALGNHELRFDPEANHFFRYFILPAGGTRRKRPVYYSFRYSNALFVAIDGNSPYDGEQAAWVERTLNAAKTDDHIRHIFLFVHQPPYAVGAYCGSERLQRKIVPLILQQPKIRAVFAGHEHAYQHLERQGVRYFVSGGGGAPLYRRSQSCNFEDDMALQLFRAEHHYLRIQVDGDAATLTAINKTREVMERILLNQPVAPDRPVTEVPPKLLAAEAAEDTAGEPPLDDDNRTVLTSAHPSARPKELKPRSLSQKAPGLVALLWLSALALLAGLLLLTRPAPRRKKARRSAARRPPQRAVVGPGPGAREEYCRTILPNNLVTVRASWRQLAPDAG